MLTKKRLALATLFGVLILGIAIFFIVKPNQRDIKKAAIRGHIDKILSLSGKLTDEEKQIYFDNYFALGKYEIAPDEELTDFGTPEELQYMREHVQALFRENPDLEVPPHSHANGQGHEHAYQKQAEKQEELAHINAAIEDVKASDAPEGAKKALLNILNHRRGVLMDDGKRFREMVEIAEKIKETEPDVIGLNWDGREYKRVYAHHLEVERRQYHYPDGTIETESVAHYYGSTDRELGPALEKYADELENIPPWETPPEPPEHPELRYMLTVKDIYLDSAGKEIAKDIYLDSAGKEIRNPAEQTSEPLDDTGDTSETVQATDTSTDILSELAQKYKESRSITGEEVSSWQEELRALEATEREELRAIFEKGVGIPLEQFMEMSDTELEAEFQKQFSISPIETGFEKALEERAMSTQNAPLRPGNDMESSLREKYSTFRFRRAMATLNHHGPEEGIRRLQEIDPEMAADVKKFQKQDREE